MFVQSLLIYGLFVMSVDDGILALSAIDPHVSPGFTTVTVQQSWFGIPRQSTCTWKGVRSRKPTRCKFMYRESII